MFILDKGRKYFAVSVEEEGDAEYYHSVFSKMIKSMHDSSWKGKIKKFAIDYFPPSVVDKFFGPNWYIDDEGRWQKTK